MKTPKLHPHHHHHLHRHRRGLVPFAPPDILFRVFLGKNHHSVAQQRTRSGGQFFLVQYVLAPPINDATQRNIDSFESPPDLTLFNRSLLE
jgi:hypothetical protein